MRIPLLKGRWLNEEFGLIDYLLGIERYRFAPKP